MRGWWQNWRFGPDWLWVGFMVMDCGFHWGVGLGVGRWRRGWRFKTPRLLRPKLWPDP